MNKEELVQKLVEEFVAKLVVLLEEELPDRGTTPSGSEEVKLSPKVLAELISHEGIVLEAYKDSKGVWTWGIGVTDASGHKVLRYKDNPQSLSKVIDIFEWLVRTKYLPSVRSAFRKTLTEEQLAAALSFHYNTGAIGRASWVKSFNEGEVDKARLEIMNWRSPSAIIPRREKERDLFFKGEWSNKGTALLYTRVNKPSYTPQWSSAKEVEIEEILHGSR